MLVCQQNLPTGHGRHYIYLKWVNHGNDAIVPKIYTNLLTCILDLEFLCWWCCNNMALGWECQLSACLSQYGCILSSYPTIPIKIYPTIHLRKGTLVISPMTVTLHTLLTPRASCTATLFDHTFKRTYTYSCNKQIHYLWICERMDIYKRERERVPCIVSFSSVNNAQDLCLSQSGISHSGKTPKALVSPVHNLAPE